MGELARQVGGPDASFADTEMILMAIRLELESRLLGAAPSAPDPSAPVVPPRRKKSSRR